MAAWYNEIDPFAAAWLRNLISAGHIAPGVVDERSIEDVVPTELMGYTQCHFFAGVGVWSHALRNAGWADDRKIWTGSCPCQPFSVAGKGDGFADERHLWPAFNHLIDQCRPALVVGEQVAAKAVMPWLDLVFDDLEGIGYTCDAKIFPACGVGSPQIRSRAYWVAAHPDGWNLDQHGVAEARLGRVGYAHNTGLERHAGHDSAAGWQGSQRPASEAGVFGGLADGESGGRARQLLRTGAGLQAHGITQDGHAGGVADGESERWNWGQNSTGPAGGACTEASGFTVGLDDPQGIRPGLCGPAHVGPTNAQNDVSENAGHSQLDRSPGQRIAAMQSGPVNGIWRAADWLGCRDGRWRPVEPGTFPLVTGLPRSMGQMQPELRRLAEMAGLDAESLARAKSYRTVGLRGYGNAINSQAAQAFIESVMEESA